MLFLITIILFAALSSIIYQDFKNRAVDIFSLSIFCLASIAYSIDQNGFLNAINNFYPVILFIVFQLIILTIIFSIKTKSFTSIFDVYLGWGDIVFWIGLAFHFSVFNFLIFHIVSLIIVSVFSLLKNYKTIPLAGGQALIFSILFLFNRFILNINTYDDLYLINYLF